MEDHRHPTEEPWPLPRLAHPRRHIGFIMIPDGAGLARRDVCKYTGTDEQTRRPMVSSHTYSQPRPAWPSSHTLGPGPRGPPAALAQSVQEEGDREGRGGAGEVGGGHQEQMRTQWLIHFLVLCWLWRGFLGLAGSTGLRSGLWDCGGILFSDSRAGCRFESPCCSGRLGFGCCC